MFNSAAAGGRKPFQTKVTVWLSELFSAKTWIFIDMPDAAVTSFNAKLVINMNITCNKLREAAAG